MFSQQCKSYYFLKRTFRITTGCGNLRRSGKIKALTLLQAISILWIILCINYTFNIHVAVYEKKNPYWKTLVL